MARALSWLPFPRVTPASGAGSSISSLNPCSQRVVMTPLSFSSGLFDGPLIGFEVFLQIPCVVSPLF